MFNNPVGCKVSKEVYDINKDFIMHDRERKAPIKGGKKAKGYGPSKVSIMDDILNEQPNGTQYFGPMSGYGDDSDFQNGFQDSEGARGAGKKRPSKGVALWNQIEKSIKKGGAGLDRQIGGNLIESKGYEMEDPLTTHDLLLGGKYSDMAPIIAQIAQKSPELLNPLIDYLPLKDTTKSTAKDVISKISNIVHKGAPIVGLILKLTGRGKHHKKIMDEMKVGGALSMDSIRALFDKSKDLRDKVKSKLTTKNAATALKVIAPIIGALLAAKAGHSIMNRGSTSVIDDPYQAYRMREPQVDENGNFNLPHGYGKHESESDSDSDSDLEGGDDYSMKDYLKRIVDLFKVMTSKRGEERTPTSAELAELTGKRRGGEKKGGKMLIPNEMLRGSFTGGAKKRTPSKWNLLVKKVMGQKGMNMKDAMMHIKSNNLYKK